MFKEHARKIWTRIAIDPRRRLGILAAGALLVVASAGILIAMRSGSLPDFRQYPAGPERKTEFFSFVHPLIASENERVLRARHRLKSLDTEDETGWLDTIWLNGLASDYGIETQEMEPVDIIDMLLPRVDIVPESLALAQAAKESGWGTSRFAREGNNLFGEWCFDPGCGIVPGNRAKGRSHEVRNFSKPGKSIRSYIRNLNTHESYQDFRDTRAGMRATGKDLSGLLLAEQLSRYSERRLVYIDEIRNLIRANDLAAFDAS
jgi:Bax protein